MSVSIVLGITIPAFIVLLLIRSYWVDCKIQQHAFAASYWVLSTKQPPEVAEELGKIWPLSHMMLEIWRWDFRRYVVHHDTYDTLMTWFEMELARDDLGPEVLERLVIDATKRAADSDADNTPTT